MKSGILHSNNVPGGHDNVTNPNNNTVGLRHPRQPHQHPAYKGLKSVTNISLVETANLIFLKSPCPSPTNLLAPPESFPNSSESSPTYKNFIPTPPLVPAPQEYLNPFQLPISLASQATASLLELKQSMFDDSNNKDDAFDRSTMLRMSSHWFVYRLCGFAS